jgi:hypothetical protein
MKQYAWYIFMLLVLCVWHACSSGSHENKVLASVNDYALYQEDVATIFPEKKLKFEDSIAILKEYVKRWITETVLMEHGKNNMPDISAQVTKKTEDFSRSLYIYEYERYYVRQNLDTNVSLAEMQAYYKDNARDFALRDYIVKVLYIRLPEDNKNLANVKQWLRSGVSQNLLKVEELARTEAENYFDGHDSWIYMDDLLREVPAKIEDKTQFLKNNTFLEVNQDGFVYYVLFFEHKLKDELSPFQMERENIRNRILHTRSAGLVEKMRKEVIKKGYKEMNIQEYVGK